MTINEDITIFNRRYDSETRRDCYITTTITDVSVYEVQSLSGEPGKHSDAISYVIRIPYNAGVSKEYISESAYAQLDDETAAGYWTIQNECYVMRGAYFSETPIYEPDIRALGGDIITVKEYADNTVRGSDVVKHWRIGGA